MLPTLPAKEIQFAVPYSQSPVSLNPSLKMLHLTGRLVLTLRKHRWLPELLKSLPAFVELNLNTRYSDRPRLTSDDLVRRDVLCISSCFVVLKVTLLGLLTPEIAPSLEALTFARGDVAPPLKLALLTDIPSRLPKLRYLC